MGNILGSGSYLAGQNMNAKTNKAIASLRIERRENNANSPKSSEECLGAYASTWWKGKLVDRRNQKKQR